MRTRGRFPGFCAAAGFALALLAAPAPAEVVSVGIANSSSDVGFFIADKKGYFREGGIEAKLIPFASASLMVAPLGAGQLDVGGGTVAAGLYNAVTRGVNVKIVADKGSIAPGYEYSTLVIRKDLVESGRYRGLADLKGMTLAAAGKGAGSESQLNEALKKGGLVFSDVTVVSLGFREQLAALENGAIDGGVIVEPSLTVALKQGIAVRASPQPIYPGQQNAVVLYSQAFAQNRHQLAVNFMIAYLKAVRDYNDALKDGRLAGRGAEGIIDILTQSTPIRNADLYREITPNAVNPDGAVNVGALAKDLAFFKERGLISDPQITVDRVLDHSFVDAALARLGHYRSAR